MTGTWGTKAAVVMSAMALLLSLSGTAFGGGDLFTDIASSPFREEINRIGRTGCASGFPGGSFKPRDNVNRQQFAFWANNCGGRAAFDDGEVTQTEPGGEELLRVELVGGGTDTPSSQGGFVVIMASVSASVDGADATLCPCSIDASVFDVVNSDNSGIALGTLASPDSQGAIHDNLSIVGVFPLDAEETGEYVLNVDYFDDQAPDVDWDGDLAAIWVPFGADGDRSFDLSG